MYSRRSFLSHSLSTSALATGIVLPSVANAEGIAVPWSTQALSGDALEGTDLDNAISKLGDHRALISLANDATLQAECDLVANQAADGVQKLSQLRNDLSDDLSDAQKTLAISLISAIVGGIGAATFAFATSPVWIGLAVGVGTASAAWSLIGFSNSSGTDRAVMGVSHFAGRFSLIGAQEGISVAAKAVGRYLSALAALADLASAVMAGIKIADVSDSLENASADLESVRQQYRAYSGDLEACRTARLAEIDTTTAALSFVRDLGDVTASSGPVVLP